MNANVNSQGGTVPTDDPILPTIEGTVNKPADGEATIHWVSWPQVSTFITAGSGMEDETRVLSKMLKDRKTDLEEDMQGANKLGLEELEQVFGTETKKLQLQLHYFQNHIGIIGTLSREPGSSILTTSWKIPAGESKSSTCHFKPESPSTRDDSAFYTDFLAALPDDGAESSEDDSSDVEADDEDVDMHDYKSSEGSASHHAYVRQLIHE